MTTQFNTHATDPLRSAIDHVDALGLSLEHIEHSATTLCEWAKTKLKSGSQKQVMVIEICDVIRQHCENASHSPDALLDIAKSALEETPKPKPRSIDVDTYLDGIECIACGLYAFADEEIREGEGPANFQYVYMAATTVLSLKRRLEVEMKGGTS